MGKTKIDEKNARLHNSYKVNFERFNRAFDNDYQIEALLIIFAVFEQITSNMIVRLASISEENYQLVKAQIVNKKPSLSYKTKVLKKLIHYSRPEMILLLKKKEKVDDLLNSLVELDRLRRIRNTLVHNLMLSNIEYEDISETNINCRKIFRIMNRCQSSIKNYIKKEHIIRKVDDIVFILEN